MGYDLRNRRGDYFAWRMSDYPRVLDLAEAYGWQPQGTTNSLIVVDGLGVVGGASPEDWDGRYTSNDYQIVSETDAANMARALEQALDDIPDTGKTPVCYTATELLDISDKTNFQELFEPGRVNLHDKISYWIGYKDLLLKFIIYLKKGSYRTG